MFKALTPIIGILVAVGLFFTYVQPTFEEVKLIQNETAQYAQAVERASELQRRISELRSQQNAIPLGDLERLEAFLPNRIDEVSLLIDIDALADEHNLVLGDIKVASDDGKESSGDLAGRSNAAALPPADATDPAADPTLDPLAGTSGSGELVSQYSTLDISFSVTGTYNNFRAFLLEVERSLVLMEVVSIEFTESEGELVPFTVTLRFYSLNAPTS